MEINDSNKLNQVRYKLNEYKKLTPSKIARRLVSYHEYSDMDFD